MSSNPDFDRWYAATHVRFLVRPSHNLETFGNTLVNYTLISELDDFPGKIRIREGRLEAHQPQIITPKSIIETVGFSDEANAYLEYLKEHEDDLRILRYGYCLKSDKFNEYVVTDPMSVVAERVKSEVLAKHDPFAAVLEGVDEPWDVSLVVLWMNEVQRSAKTNLKELQEKGKLF